MFVGGVRSWGVLAGALLAWMALVLPLEWSQVATVAPGVSLACGASWLYNLVRLRGWDGITRQQWLMLGATAALVGATAALTIGWIAPLVIGA
jgi:hypothetical protein